MVLPPPDAAQGKVVEVRKRQGSTALAEAADGVQQALKLHARRIDLVEQRVDTEIMGLHASLLALRTDVQELRRGVAAVVRSIPADLAEHVDAEMALLLDLEEVDGGEPRSEPASAPRGDAAKETR